MIKGTRNFIVAALLLGSASTLAAQTVGSLPDKSPYVDLNDGQQFGIVAGYLVTGHDAVGVGPKSAPILGVRYDLSIGGAAYLTGTVFGASTQRTILDYSRPAAMRNVGTETQRLVNFNVALAVALTGQRSWHHIQPLINIGVGLVSGIGDKPDVSDYAFGSSFSFSGGLGVRYVTGKNSELRADMNWYYWSIKYPELYRSTQGDAIAIKPTGDLSSGTINGAFTVAWTLRVFR